MSIWQVAVGLPATAKLVRRNNQIGLSGRQIQLQHAGVLTDGSPVEVLRRSRRNSERARRPRIGAGTGRLGAAVALALCFTACAGSSPGQPASSSAPAASSAVPSSPQSTVSSSASPVKATSSAPTTASSSVAAAVAPICTKEVLRDAVNVGRDNQLTVSESTIMCQDGWAALGADDTVNKAQYTFVLRWTDDQWQATNRNQACADQQIPAALVRLACNSN